MNLIVERCFNHGGREAAARCVLCGRFYCRECVTEHADRILCAGCLRAQVAPGSRRRAWLAVVRLVAAALFGLCLAQQVFLRLGLCLARLPTKFHEGSTWNVGSHGE